MFRLQRLPIKAVTKLWEAIVNFANVLHRLHLASLQFSRFYHRKVPVRALEAIILLCTGENIPKLTEFLLGQQLSQRGCVICAVVGLGSAGDGLRQLHSSSPFSARADKHVIVYPVFYETQFLLISAVKPLQKNTLNSMFFWLILTLMSLSDL